MDLLHSTWFWVLAIVGPIVSVIGTLAKLSKKQGPIKLPPGVIPGTYATDKQDDEDKADGAAKKP
ncbi:hypothetical protein [Vogesella oryzae]|uniref:hypothetical protein n=1 Tax=Vogesella oryzae TaxID=1735285 RepID=UPI0015840FDD|nr:hypothetical protein [Vogesella oryzae]